MNITDTASYLELGWTAMSFVALAGLLAALAYAVGNRRWAERTYPRDRVMHRMARAFVRLIGALAMIPFLFFVVGLLAMDTPPNPASEARVTSTVSAVAFMLANGVLTATALGFVAFMRNMRRTPGGRRP